MIKTRSELREYLVADAYAMYKKREKPRCFWNGTISDCIWRYTRLLRYYEYHINNKHVLLGKYYQIRYTRLGIKLGFDIPPNVFGKGLNIVHLGTIVVSPKVKVGDYCSIYQNVTLGEEKSKAPVIGTGCCILPGAKVFGDIVIGNNCMIGANSVVNRSFGDNSRIAGVPGRLLNSLGNEYLRIKM